MTCLQKWRADEIHGMPAAIRFRNFCHPGWNLKNVKCQRYRTVIFSVVSCGIEISGVPNGILPDTETGLFKTRKTGTNGILLSGRFPIRNPVGTQAIRLRFVVVFHSSWRQNSGYYLKLEQWRTQEFCSGGRVAGFNKFSWGQRTERTGIWGR